MVIKAVTWSVAFALPTNSFLFFLRARGVFFQYPLVQWFFFLCGSQRSLLSPLLSPLRQLNSAPPDGVSTLLYAAIVPRPSSPFSYSTLSYYWLSHSRSLPTEWLIIGGARWKYSLQGAEWVMFPKPCWSPDRCTICRYLANLLVPNTQPSLFTIELPLP